MQNQHSDRKQQKDAQTRNQEWPNDFNLQAETAEQQEIVQSAKTWYPTPALSCSEYDF